MQDHKVGELVVLNRGAKKITESTTDDMDALLMPPPATTAVIVSLSS